MSEMEFKYLGFKPDEVVRDFASTVAEKLQYSAPSDASMKFILEKCNDAVRASCRIASQAGEFMAEAMNENPIRAVQQIERKIRMQLNRWKASRFKEHWEKSA